MLPYIETEDEQKQNSRTTTGESTMAKRSAAGHMALEPMTQEEFYQAMRECAGKKLVDHLWCVQDADEYINYTAMVFAEHGKIAEIRYWAEWIVLPLGAPARR
jgi:hypothetical protein